MKHTEHIPINIVANIVKHNKKVVKYPDAKVDKSLPTACSSG